METVEKAKYKTSLIAPGLKNNARVTNIIIDLENEKGPVYNYKLDKINLGKVVSKQKNIRQKR